VSLSPRVKPSVIRKPRHRHGLAMDQFRPGRDPDLGAVDVNPRGVTVAVMLREDVPIMCCMAARVAAFMSPV